MREIKFRVWCKEHNEWESNPTFITDNGTLFSGLVRSAIPLRNDSHVVMQYTGLEDVNGKEICEGDILQRNDNSVTVVEFENGMFVTKYDALVWELRENNLVVIGNVYQNPELLE